MGKSILSAMSPPNNHPAAIKPAIKKGAVNAPQTYIVVGTLPAATTQMVPVQAIAQPIQSQVPFVTVPQNAVLTAQPISCTVSNGNRTITYTQMPRHPQQIVTQSCFTTPMNSPQMLPMGSPQAAQSPPQVPTPEMSQAQHDFHVNSPPGPTSPPQPSATTLVNPAQNNIYQLSNVH